MPIQENERGNFKLGDMECWGRSLYEGCGARLCGWAGGGYGIRGVMVNKQNNPYSLSTPMFLVLSKRNSWTADFEVVERCRKQGTIEIWLWFANTSRHQTKLESCKAHVNRVEVQNTSLLYQQDLERYKVEYLSHILIFYSVPDPSKCLTIYMPIPLKL